MSNVKKLTEGEEGGGGEEEGGGGGKRFSIVILPAAAASFFAICLLCNCFFLRNYLCVGMVASGWLH
jgi:hypothetical protein